ncbi:MAG: polyprenyl synthetase family protein [Pseudomonadota bacterium]
MNAFNIQAYLQEKKLLIDAELERLLPANDEVPPQLHEAMRYCLFAGGKRLRPILALAAAEAAGGNPDAIIREACALELLHTYTLVHDDLPSMDNDDYRRGRLTTHKVFGEAAAILAGDALQAEAFRILAEGCKTGSHKPETIVEVIHCLADACGPKGIIGGQVVDMASEGKVIEKDVLEYIHIHKTGRLLTASVMLGAILGESKKNQLKPLREYGDAIGLAFQITDDILDVLGSTEHLGKKVGSDEKRGKATYPGIMGMAEAKKMQAILYRQALDALTSFDAKAEPLRNIARIIIERNS